MKALFDLLSIRGKEWSSTVYEPMVKYLLSSWY